MSRGIFCFVLGGVGGFGGEDLFWAEKPPQEKHNLPQKKKKFFKGRKKTKIPMRVPGLVLFLRKVSCIVLGGVGVFGWQFYFLLYTSDAAGDSLLVEKGGCFSGEKKKKLPVRIL